MNKGCNNCKNYKPGKIQIYKKDIPHKCILGKTKELDLWWLENGKKINLEDLTDMPCFQETITFEFFQNILNDLNKILL